MQTVKMMSMLKNPPRGYITLREQQVKFMFSSLRVQEAIDVGRAVYEQKIEDGFEEMVKFLYTVELLCMHYSRFPESIEFNQKGIALVTETKGES